ncbi:hypothetical protein [Pseudomonas sp. 91RF]|uniref:hypothetical protein n=1 Tax=Pseudomonas sp. 91RF TaxID=2292261 RepID=UPI0021150400|nr:hypothetical protein [Pseudomonas sp. 91RF]
MGLIKPSWLLGSLLGCIALVQTAVAADAIVVGDKSGQSAVAHGPVQAAVELGSCRFSMPLLQDQWLTFESFYLVFVADKQLPTRANAPGMWQAETSSGYDWHFEKSGNLSQPWFGAVCESADSFSLLTARKPPENDSIALQLLRDDNDRRCPATLTDHGWEPTSLAGPKNRYTFEDWVERSLRGSSSASTTSHDGTSPASRSACCAAKAC